MGDEEPEGESLPFYVERAKTGRSGCKKCKQKIGTGELRLGKLGFNPFSSGTMKLWHHVNCMFEVFAKQRKTTKKIDSFNEIGGWDDLADADKETIKSQFAADDLERIEKNTAADSEKPSTSKKPTTATDVDNKDNSFRAFRKICADLTNASSYLTKTSIVKEFFEKGTSGDGFTGDLLLWVKSLLPMAAKRVYNLQSKQLVKIFSDIFRTDQEAMLEDLEQGDVAETIGKFFENGSKVTPTKKAVLTLHDVENFLEHLSKLTREVDQIDHFKSILPKCTNNDLKIIIRLIKHDLRINAGPKHILEALDPKAYPAFQASRDLAAVVRNATNGTSESKKGEGKGMQVGISIMTPVLPMLAQACTSVEMAFSKCPEGMFSEVKYDGERVQLHKKGNTFKYFSRSLKPVMAHKVKHFSKYIPEAFPHGEDLILDSEILMVDTNTGKPLPFGTLGAHKKNEVQDAVVCLFVFDCIYYNGESLTEKPIKERRKILLKNMKEITHRVMFSEMEEIHDREDLESMIERVLREGLEGLVLKPLMSTYKPGKRHWLKVKKDYLAGGSMADSADLVVLGAWFGTGKKGGIMSIFLMGCYDEKRRRWVTVTKVHGGHDDKTLDALQKQLKMDKISKDASKVPNWLHCAKTMVPDFVAKDPRESQVWEITGAEFTCNQVHTADGISIRFPRVTRIRKDKTWETATSLSELKKLFAASKDTSNFTLQRGQDSPTKQKRSRDKSPNSGSTKKTTTSPKETKKVKTESPKQAKPSPRKEKKELNNHASKKLFDSSPESKNGSGSETEVDEDKKSKESPKEKQAQSQVKKKRKPTSSSEEDSETEVDEDKKQSKEGKSKKESPKGKQPRSQVKKKRKSSSSEADGSGSETEVDEDKKQSKEAESKKESPKEKQPRSQVKKKRKPSRSSENDSETEVDEDKKQSKEGKTKKESPKEKAPSSQVKKKRKISSETEHKHKNGGSDSETDVDEGKKSLKEIKSEDKLPKEKEISSKLATKRKNSSSPLSTKDDSETDIDEDKKPEKSQKTPSKKESPSKKGKQSSSKEQKIKRLFSSDSESEKETNNSGSETEVDEDPTPNSSVSIAMKNHLPEVFKDVVVYFLDKVPDKPLLRRFVIAYGGKIFSRSDRNSLENSNNKITHVIYPSRKGDREPVKSSRCADRVYHVASDWLWESIKSKRREEESDYKIKSK